MPTFANLNICMSTYKDDKDNQVLIDTIVAAIDSKKGEQPVLADFSDMTGIASRYFVICEGHSSTQVEAIAHEVSEQTRKQLGRKPFGATGLERCTWVVLDYGDVMVHIFQPAARHFYDLEHLWSAPISELVVPQQADLPQIPVGGLHSLRSNDK